MSFQVGQKVVCVDDDFSGGSPYWRERTPNLPKKNAVYVVREIEEWFGLVCLRLAEIINPLCDWEYLGTNWKREVAFGARRFRPLTERKTDISIFREMLAGAPKEMEPAE